MLTDGLLAAGLLVALSMLRFGPDYWAIWWQRIVRDPLAFLFLYAAGWVVALAANGLYRPRTRWSIRSEAGDVARATLVMALATLAVLFWFKLPDVSRMLLVALFPAQFVLTLAMRATMRLFFRRLRRMGMNARHVLVAGAGPRGRAFAVKLESHLELGLRVIGFVDDDPAFAEGLRWPYLGRLEDVERILHERVVDEVAICLPAGQWSYVGGIAHLAEEQGKIVRVPMDLLDPAFSAARVEDLDGTPVYSLVSGPDRAMALAAKRFVDLLVAAAGLVLLAPLFLVIAVLVKGQDGGSVIFSQVRVGLHGRSFRMLKFRSMVPGAERLRDGLMSANEVNGSAFKVTHDPRVTRVGRWLRRFSLDELPQLWNVLRGEMSLVGPRPPLPEEVSGYDLWHRRRLSMKPGITGLWQVRARREPEFDRWVAADLEYIDRWSLWLDLKILARTIPAALEGR